MIDRRTAHFILIAKNKTITIEYNRPFFRNKGLKKRRYDLKILGGEQPWNIAFMASIYEQIELLVEMYLERDA